MAKVVEAADNLVDEYRGGCFGAFKNRLLVVTVLNTGWDWGVERV